MQNKNFPEECAAGRSYPPHQCSICPRPDDPTFIQSLPPIGDGKILDVLSTEFIDLSSADTDLVLPDKERKC